MLCCCILVELTSTSRTFCSIIWRRSHRNFPSQSTLVKIQSVPELIALTLPFGCINLFLFLFRLIFLQLFGFFIHYLDLENFSFLLTLLAQLYVLLQNLLFELFPTTLQWAFDENYILELVGKLFILNRLRLWQGFFLWLRNILDRFCMMLDLGFKSWIVFCLRINWLLIHVSPLWKFSRLQGLIELLVLSFLCLLKIVIRSSFQWSLITSIPISYIRFDISHYFFLVLFVIPGYLGTIGDRLIILSCILLLWLYAFQLAASYQIISMLFVVPFDFFFFNLLDKALIEGIHSKFKYKNSKKQTKALIFLIDFIRYDNIKVSGL